MQRDDILSLELAVCDVLEESIEIIPPIATVVPIDTGF